jgi:carnosine N-methyltransferase
MELPVDLDIVADCPLIPLRTDEIGKYKLYPYVHSFSNVPTRQAMLHPVYIPDVLPSALPTGSDFSLVAGQFRDLFQRRISYLSSAVR